MYFVGVDSVGLSFSSQYAFPGNTRRLVINFIAVAVDSPCHPALGPYLQRTIPDDKPKAPEQIDQAADLIAPKLIKINVSR